MKFGYFVPEKVSEAANKINAWEEEGMVMKTYYEVIC